MKIPMATMLPQIMLVAMTAAPAALGQAPVPKVPPAATKVVPPAPPDRVPMMIPVPTAPNLFAAASHSGVEWEISDAAILQDRLVVKLTEGWKFVGLVQLGPAKSLFAFEPAKTPGLTSYVVIPAEIGDVPSLTAALAGHQDKLFLGAHTLTSASRLLIFLRKSP